MKNDSLIEIFAVFFEAGEIVTTYFLNKFFFKKDIKDFTTSKGNNLLFSENVIGFQFSIIGEGIQSSSNLDWECQEGGFKEILGDWFEDFEKIAIKILNKQINIDSLHFITLWGYKKLNIESDSEYELKGILRLENLKLIPVNDFLNEDKIFEPCPKCGTLYSDDGITVKKSENPCQLCKALLS